MNWLTRAEVRFGFLAIPGLPRIIVALNALTFILGQLSPDFYQLLELDGPLVRQGQVWRLVTFLFIPRWGSFLPAWLGVLLYLLYLNFIGQAVERAMGPFRFTLYYLLGMIGLALSALFFAGPEGGRFGNGLLNLSLLFAFVRFYPDAVFLLMFVLPVKAVWMAWISAAGLIMQFLTLGMEFRLSLLAGLLNYLFFFGAEIVGSAAHRQATAARKEEFDRQMRESAAMPLHECAVCHRTETTPELEFRVSRDGQEYCLEHLPKPAAG